MVENGPETEGNTSTSPVQSGDTPSERGLPQKTHASRSFQAENDPSTRPTHRARPTRAMVRAKCAECLNLAGNRCGGFDCDVLDCPIYPAMPWRGKRMPLKLR